MPLRYLSHLDVLKPAFAMLGAAVSYIGGLIGSAQLPGLGWWFESGGMVALVGCLIYGLLALWRSRGEERRVMLEQIEWERKEAKVERDDLIRRLDAKDAELHDLNEEVRANHRQQNTELVEALNKLHRALNER